MEKIKETSENTFVTTATINKLSSQSISAEFVYNNTIYNCYRGIVMNGWSEAGKMVNNLVKNNIIDTCTVALRASGGGDARRRTAVGLPPLSRAGRGLGGGLWLCGG